MTWDVDFYAACNSNANFASGINDFSESTKKTQ